MAPATATNVPLRPRIGAASGGAAVALLATLVAVGAVAVHRVTGRYWGDLAVYRAGGSAAEAGDGGLYQVAVRGADGIELGFTYPPFAALLFQPFAAVGPQVAIGIWTLGSMLALAAVLRLALRSTGVPDPRLGTLTLVGTVAALPMFAVSGHLQVGQVGLFLMLIVLVDLTGDQHRWWYGLGVGVAAGIKLTPLVFVVLLLATGRVRAAATAVGGFLGTVAVGFCWRPEDSSAYWSGAILDTSRVTADLRTILNQSLPGALARLTDSGDLRLGWLLVALVGAAGLAVAVWCVRAGEELLGVLACATTGLLVSPISWHHHWVWAVPALAVLAERAWRLRSRVGLAAVGLGWLAFVAGTGWVLVGLRGQDLHFDDWALLYSNLYVLTGLVLLGWLPVPLRQAARTARQTGTPAYGAAERDGAYRPDRVEHGGGTPAPARTDAVRVSVVIPNYNKEKTLRACLTAVYAQTLPPAEVIVVDDASTDRSRQIAAGFPCTLLAFPANRGVSAARNAGAARATGEVLFFVDSDIALAPDALAAAVGALREHPRCGVVQGIYDLHPLFADGPVESYKTLFEHYWRRRAVGVTSSTMFALTAVPRPVFDAVGGFDERLRDAEDVEFGTRLPASYEIRTSDRVIGRHDDVDRLWPYLSELFRRALTYAGAVVVARWTPPAMPGPRPAVATSAGDPLPADGSGSASGPERRDPHRIDLGSLAGMLASASAVATLPLAVASPWLLAVPLALLAGFLAADRELLTFALRQRGPGFLLYATLIRFLTHLTEFAGLTLGVARAMARRTSRLWTARRDAEQNEGGR
ncbi:glycosyltransferase 87 family protein [Plantactinospora alkalitolerans]|uniref:glycosyltransferase 87 family protein n=1 Tax=Plantactinospora alkalitolerans TaxID=2789879 RepID=UPI001E427916|nr:glycosyltransferase 87 family protein [Plantactinospora alkalitolerans]